MVVKPLQGNPELVKERGVDKDYRLRTPTNEGTNKQMRNLVEGVWWRKSFQTEDQRYNDRLYGLYYIGL